MYCFLRRKTKKTGVLDRKGNHSVYDVTCLWAKLSSMWNLHLRGKIRSVNEKGDMVTSMAHTGKTVESTQWHCHCHLAVTEETLKNSLIFWGTLMGLVLSDPAHHPRPWSVHCHGEVAPFHLLDTSPCSIDNPTSCSPALSPECTSDLISWSHPSDTCHDFSPVHLFFTLMGCVDKT